MKWTSQSIETKKGEEGEEGEKEWTVSIRNRISRNAFFVILHDPLKQFALFVAAPSLIDNGVQFRCQRWKLPLTNWRAGRDFILN